MKRLLLVCMLACLPGCGMFKTWKSIPPPGGCNQCHTVAITTNWQVAYQPVAIADERGRQSFQTPEYNMPVQGRQDSPIEAKKVEELRCFECHKSPSPAHLNRSGRFHH